MRTIDYPRVLLYCSIGLFLASLVMPGLVSEPNIHLAQTGTILLIFLAGIFFYFYPGMRGFGFFGPSYEFSESSKHPGNKLREAFQREYDRLVASGGLNAGIHGTDVSGVLEQYIPPGTTFQEAEQDLLTAGFTIKQRPNAAVEADPNRAVDWYAVVATISPFASAGYSRIDLSVSLLPPAPGEYSVVKKATAVFFVTAP